MKTIVAGTRNFGNYVFMTNALNYFYISEVVTGGCNGADLLGKRYAEQFGIPYKEFKAQWETYGKTAGPMRNAEMAAHAEACVVFWDGLSRGSRDMIDKAHTKGLDLTVVFTERAKLDQGLEFLAQAIKTRKTPIRALIPMSYNSEVLDDLCEGLGVTWKADRAEFPGMHFVQFASEDPPAGEGPPIRGTGRDRVIPAGNGL